MIIRCPKASKAVVELLDQIGALGSMPKTTQMSLFLKNFYRQQTAGLPPTQRCAGGGENSCRWAGWALPPPGGKKGQGQRFPCPSGLSNLLGRDSLRSRV